MRTRMCPAAECTRGLLHVLSRVQKLAGALGFQQLGLQGLAAGVLGRDVAKGERLADWQQLQLSPECAAPALFAWLLRCGLASASAWSRAF